MTTIEGKTFYQVFMQRSLMYFVLLLLTTSCRERSTETKKIDPQPLQTATPVAFRCDGLLLNSSSENETLQNLLEGLSIALQNGNRDAIRKLFLSYVNETIRQSSDEVLPPNIVEAINDLSPELMIELAKKSVNEGLSLSFSNNECVRRVEETLGKNANSIVSEGYAEAMKQKVDEAEKKLAALQESNNDSDSGSNPSNNPNNSDKEDSGQTTTENEKATDAVKIGPTELPKEQVKWLLTGIGSMLVVFSAYLGYQAVYGTKKAMQQHLDTDKQASEAVGKKYDTFLQEFAKDPKNVKKAGLTEIDSFRRSLTESSTGKKATLDADITQKYSADRTSKARKFGVGAGVALAVGITAILAAQIGLNLEETSSENEYIGKYLDNLKSSQVIILQGQ